MISVVVFLAAAAGVSARAYSDADCRSRYSDCSALLLGNAACDRACDFKECN